MKHLFYRLILIVTLVSTWSPAHAMIVFDPTVFAKLAEEMLVMQEQLDDLNKELKALSGGQYQWSNAQTLINQLGSTINQSNAIAYSAADVNNKFQSIYPGYKAPDNYSQSYQQVVQSTMQTLNNVLQAMGTSAQDFQNENNRLQFLQSQSQSAQGQMQAIQAASQIASEQVSQLQLLRQTLMAQANSQTAYYAAQMQKDASEEASMHTLFSSNDTNYSADQGHAIWQPAN
jgi:P-type conjugative transfer protein TrbJ